MKIFSISRMLLALGFLMAVTVSCSDDDEPTPTPVIPNDIQLKDTQTLGKVLTDKDGKTLYYFTKDFAGTSACSGGCATKWPVFSVTDMAKMKLDAGLTAADFGTITRADGKPQTTYKGWPLYYFQDDAAAGELKGENAGGVWFVAKPTYSIMLANGQLVGHDGKSYKADMTEGTGETQFFVDAAGRTLYSFARDSTNNNNFTNNDAAHDAVWPIYTAEITDIPSAIDKSLFATIDVFGKKQLTYKGWPLYYYGADNATRGLTKGMSFPRVGVWPIVNKDSPNAPK